VTLSDLDRKLSRHGALLLLGFGALLLLPRLTSFGLWDPSEVHIADAARTLLDTPMRPNQVPPSLTVRFVEEGFRLIGIGELGGRLPLALCSLLAILCTYYLGRALLRPRGALLGAVALATMPSFLFGARQLTSGAPGVLALALALAGLARLSWAPADERPLGRAAAALAALAGLALGHAASGLLVGVIAPILTIATALLATDRGRTRGRVLGLLALGLFIAGGLAWRKHASYSWLLGAVPRAPQYQTVVTSLLRQLGFASAPWLAVAPFAILRGLDGEQTTRDGTEERAEFSRLVLPAALAVTYLCATLHEVTLADLIVPAAPILALLAGAWFDDALEQPGVRAIEGVSIAALAIILGHDIMLTTDAFVSVQASEQIRWPQPIYWTGNVLFGFLSAFGALVAIALALPVVWGEQGAPQRDRTQRSMLCGALVVQVLFAFALVQWFVPLASKHLSPKDLYGKTKQLDPHAPLGQYRFNATGASYFMGGRGATSFNTGEEVIRFLQHPERVFVFIGSDELAGIDQVARRGGQPPAAPTDGASTAPPAVATNYYVIDDSNSRFLILSNRLGPGEVDLNPLRRFISNTAPTPQTALAVNFEDKLELIGFDVPAEVQRGQDIRVRLYFKVLAPVGAAYKVFLHFDGPGARVNGDHVPVDGRFPTQFWTPGTYVTDEYQLKPDRATEPSGAFQLYFGLFAGDRRLKVKSGPNDGENRVRLSSVHVK
jgi:4-amino-4-deoxy-L-arabinose transferase-like glycosyltransferase